MINNMREHVSCYRIENQPVRRFASGVVTGVKYAVGTALAIAAAWGFVQAYEHSRLNGATSGFAAEMTPELLDPDHNLKPGEIFHQKKQIVAAGGSLAEKLKMQVDGTAVNVRPLPATTILSGFVDVPVVGILPQGSEISRAIDIDGEAPGYNAPARWTVFNCSSAPIIWADGKQIPSKGAICTVFATYTAPVDSK